jgi:hypothetical protein
MIRTQRSKTKILVKVFDRESMPLPPAKRLGSVRGYNFCIGVCYLPDFLPIRPVVITK